MEILTVDRDADPLVFDPEIIDNKDKLTEKMADVLDGRLHLLFELFKGKKPSQIADESAGMFERLRFLEKDPPDDSID